MNILFVTGQPYIPQMRGGLQSSAHTLATEMKKRGHNTAVLSALMPNGYLGVRGRLIMKLARRKSAKDTTLGYPVWRAWFPWEAVAEVAREFKPDIVVVLARQPVRMALAAKAAGLPILMKLQDVEFVDHGGDFAALGDVPCIANSAFTAKKYHDKFGIHAVVIHPLMNADLYKTNTTRENVTLINPHPCKGGAMALAIAKLCPDIPFTFVETWPLKPHERAELEGHLKSLPNVTLRPATSDMRDVYGKCKILLAPSKWEEAYGRVGSEPKFSGIPVVASNRGGLPEAVGKGGVLLDPEGDPEIWAEAIRKLWNDAAYYQQMSDAAYAHMQEPAFNIDHQTELWMQQINAALKKK